MNICFINNLHLPPQKGTLQYKALDWAVSDACKKEADRIIFTGDIALEKSHDVYAWLTEKMNGCGIPFEIAPESNDYGIDTKSLQALDPDTAVGESPCITYLNTETNALRKMYYFCAVPTDLYKNLGLSCHDAAADILFATENKLSSLELFESCLQTEKDKLVKLISKWRSEGGRTLLVHVPESNSENMDKLITLCKSLKADFITLDIPPVPYEALDDLTEKLNAIDHPVTIGVKNARMTDGERRYGCTPDECIEFKNMLTGKCKLKVGIFFDIANAKNNGTLTEKCPVSTWLALVGEHIVGYRLYGLAENGGKIKAHMPITDIYGDVPCFATFFRSWAEGFIPKVPVIFDIRQKDGYRQTLDAFNVYKNKKVFDIHSHTYYSNCGIDDPYDLIEQAILNGISVLGISDHNYGIAERKPDYINEIESLKKEYDGRIKILCGIELSTLPHLYDLKTPDEIKKCDYCLLEHILEPESIVGNDLFGFAEKIGITCGIAHTDMFEYCNRFGYDYNEFFKKMAEHKMFWEMNVSYDSIHKYREHGYVTDFMTDKNKQDIIKNAGVYVSVGFDSHRHEDYYGFKIHQMYDFLKKNNIKTADELL